MKRSVAAVPYDSEVPIASVYIYVYKMFADEITNVSIIDNCFLVSKILKGSE